ncbi:MAG: hypothetical protein M0R03_14535 [Novosphingobium sp.]|nr:hypothetical protein [Novosphingobium sp.]
MQTCVETVGTQHRGVEINRNDYSNNDIYSKSHKDALSDGDSRGIGSGHSGHSHDTPDCTKAEMDTRGVYHSPIDRKNFDTGNTYGDTPNIGNDYDINGANATYTRPGRGKHTPPTSSGRRALLQINNFNNMKEYDKDENEVIIGVPMVENGENYQYINLS